MDISLDHYIKLNGIRRPRNVGGRRDMSLKQRIAQKIVARSRQTAFGGRGTSRGSMIASKVLHLKRIGGMNKKLGGVNFQRRYGTPAQMRFQTPKRQFSFLQNTLNGRKQRGMKWMLIHKKIQRAARNIKAQQFKRQQRYVPQARQQMQRQQGPFGRLQNQRQQGLLVRMQAQQQGPFVKLQARRQGPLMKLQALRQRGPQIQRLQVPLVRRPVRRQQYLPQLQAINVDNTQNQRKTTYNIIHKKIQRAKAQQRKLSAVRDLSQTSNVGSGLRVSIKNELSRRINRAKTLQNLQGSFENEGELPLPITVASDDVVGFYRGPTQKRRQYSKPPRIFSRQTKTYFARDDDDEAEERSVHDFHAVVQTTGFTLDERFSSH